MQAALKQGTPGVVPCLFRSLLRAELLPDALSYTNLISAFTVLGRFSDAVRPPGTHSMFTCQLLLPACSAGLRATLASPDDLQAISLWCRRHKGPETASGMLLMLLACCTEAGHSAAAARCVCAHGWPRTDCLHPWAVLRAALQAC